MDQARWLWLADLVLLLHVAFVAFVVLGLVLVLVGGALHWQWVHHRGFRIAHLLAILFVVAQTWFDQICPLTTLEMALRVRAGDTVYSGSFIGHWMQRLLYYDAPLWVFAVAYTAFALLVAWAWWRVPPRPQRRRSGRG